jgi:hypothetical protein
MTSLTAAATAEDELRSALERLAAFDASTLVNEDGTSNEAAQSELARLQRRADAALEQMRRS